MIWLLRRFRFALLLYGLFLGGVWVARRVFAAHTPRAGIRLHEPMTAVTDFLLALLALYFARRLWAQARTKNSRTQRTWAVGFVASALAAFAGGAYHGFGPDLPQSVRALLWKLTMIGAGLTSFCMLLGTVFASTRPTRQLLWIALVTFKSLIYARWVIRENDFRFVVYDYASAMLTVLAVQLREYNARPAARRIAQAIGVSVLAAIVQRAGINLHTHFNKNDLYHVIQGVGFVLFYRGASKLEDRRSAPPASQK